MINGTGRLRGGLDPRVRRLLYGDANALIDADLEPATRVDLAHVVMLAETRLLPVPAAARLAAAIVELRTRNFDPLRAMPIARGTYLHLESYLIAELGERGGGSLQLGRSRNDLNATVLLLRLRPHVMSLVSEALRLLAALVMRACATDCMTMAGYTHFQPAQPITFGHYLSGVGFAVARDVQGVLEAASGIDACPLGAGALAGTSLPIETRRTAELLGFAESCANSVDAVASRDVVLRLLAAATVFGVTLSRLATDLLTWSTQEFGFITFPDSLSGSSSMMPQKRNAFTLEHIQGRASAALGAFTSAAAAMASKPFSNSVAVGTESIAPVFDALTRTTQATFLSRLAVLGAQLDPAAMYDKAERGYVTATAFADALVSSGRSSFRDAHRSIGIMVGDAIERGCVPLAEIAAVDGLPELSPDAVATAANYGGGPGVRSSRVARERLKARWRELSSRKARTARVWAAAAARLDEAVAELIRRGNGAGTGDDAA